MKKKQLEKFMFQYEMATNELENMNIENDMWLLYQNRNTGSNINEFHEHLSDHFKNILNIETVKI